MSTKAAVVTPLTTHVKIELQDTFALSIEARLAFELCTHLSFATADVDGEDSAGRQKVRLLNPSEVAARACQITEHMLSAFSARGWTVPIPDLEAARAAWKEQIRKEEEEFLAKQARKNAKASEAANAALLTIGTCADPTVPIPSQPHA